MIIILPNDCTGLDDLQAALASFDLNSFDSHMSSTKVIVTVPKFTIETSLALNEPLSQMGMGIIFSGSADFGGILASNDPLQVSAVIQKAYINVDENGTVAAAATGVIVTTTAVIFEPPPIYFTADHPFVYLIKSSSGILFMGRYVTPSS